MWEYYVFAMFIAVLVCIVAIVFKVLFSNVKRQNEMLDEREKEILKTYNAVETIMEEFQDQAKATIDELKHREGEYRAAMMNIAAFQLPQGTEKKEQVIEKVPRAMGMDAGRIKVATDVIERAEHMMYNEPPPAVTPANTPVHTQVNSPVNVPAPQPVSTVVSPPEINTAGVVVTPLEPDAPPAQPPAPEIFSTPATKPVFQKFFDDALEAPPPTPYAPVSVTGGSRRDEIIALADAGKTDVEIASKLGITRNEVQLVIGLR